MLRIDSNILWTIINLLILYALMKHFLFQPVHDILDKRKQEIESDFALANQQKQEALESKNKANQQLENMQTICDGMLADAKEQASLEYEQIIADANKKSDEMIEQARIKTIEVANEEKAKAKSEIADLINKAADKITNTKSDEKLYDDFLKVPDRDDNIDFLCPCTDRHFTFSQFYFGKCLGIRKISRHYCRLNLRSFQSLPNNSGIIRKYTHRSDIPQIKLLQFFQQISSKILY